MLHGTSGASSEENTRGQENLPAAVMISAVDGDVNAVCRPLPAFKHALCQDWMSRFGMLGGQPTDRFVQL
jgi:hypothetical protein